jgi:Mn-dependent DtxR family transcriptional regulator
LTVKDHLRELAKPKTALVINRLEIALFFGVHERSVREACAELAKEEHIYFVPIRDKGWKYMSFLHIDGVNDEHLLRELQGILAHLKSEFFNRIYPYRGFIKDQQQGQLMDRLFDAFSMVQSGEEDNNGIQIRD